MLGWRRIGSMSWTCSEEVSRIGLPRVVSCCSLAWCVNVGITD